LLPRGARFLIAAALATPAINAQARGGRAAPGMIRGTVIDHYSSRPSVDRLVVVGKAKATTDIDGRFAIPAPAGPYDITVVDRNRSAVTFFRGLRRRDPVLLHYGDPNLVPNGYETHAAHIDGTLSGGGYDPKTSNMATVYFSSPQVVRDKTLGGRRTARPAPGSARWTSPGSAPPRSPAPSSPSARRARSPATRRQRAGTRVPSSGGRPTRTSRCRAAR